MTVSAHAHAGTHAGSEAVTGNGWLPFEHLVGEAFRRRGYRVDNSQLGLDGGLDLVLHRDGQHVLAQCKPWRQQPVGVEVVQEMLDLLDREQAHAGTIASLGGYTYDATQLAAGKLELIDSDALLGMIREVRANPASPLAS